MTTVQRSGRSPAAPAGAGAAPELRSARRPHGHLLFVLGMVLLALVVLSVFIGRYPEPFVMSPRLLWQDDMAAQLVMKLRLPRILTACLLGVTLSACGTVLQMIFRNPLVEPGFLGVSQGAAFGAAIGIVFLAASPLVTEGLATLFACLGLAASYLIARQIRYGGWILRLILAGIAVSALFASGVGMVKYLADPLTELPDLIFWLLGGLWAVTWTDLLYLLPFVIGGLTVVYLMRWRLNLLSLEEDTGFSLGVATGRERTVVLVAAVAATAALVSVAGVVGWIGLLVPHVARRLTGADGRRALPAAMLLGGIFALICDGISRTLLAGEIPLGIVASLLGASLFIAMMVGGKVQVQR